ncbi:MAG: beta-propeller fold lactonase family protein [Pseudomonadales bacterium]|nr:beta-propeller fold lactonase family protein [Pseudomonadales bacterium]
MITLLIGTYTRNTGSEGIYRCTWDADAARFGTPTLAVVADNPSFLIQPFLVQEGNDVFAVHETADFAGAPQGAVARYRIAGDRLELLELVGSGGADPCHVAVAGDRLAVANYSGASVGLFRVGTGPGLERVNVVRFEGRGPHPRQAAAHPHGVYFHAGELLVPDLGLDCVHRLDPVSGALRGRFTLEPGSGPRQLAIDAVGRSYVLNELSNHVDLLDSGSVVQRVATLPEVPRVTPGQRPIVSTAGSIALAAGGRCLVASNRGVDSLVAYAIDERSGRIGPPLIQPCDPHPRHFAVIGGHAIVASRDAGTLCAFELARFGTGAGPVARVACPAPVCVLSVPAVPG